MKNSTRAAIYTRISNDKEGAGLGVQRQQEDCRVLAESLGWSVVEVYEDNDISAYQRKKPRTGYNAMLKALEDGTVSAVLAWHSDRLHRRTAELETFLQVIEGTRAEVATVKSGLLDLSSPDGRMVAKFHGAIAQREVEHGRDRISRQKKQAANDGKWRGGPRPFGYEDDGVTVREREADALRQAVASLLAGQSLRSIAKEMADRGVLTASKKSPSPMDEQALRRILLRPRNAGLVEAGGEILPVKAQWAPILTEDSWRAAVSLLADPSRKTTTGNGRRWLGSGLYICGLCGSTMRTTMSGDKIRVYRCNALSHVSRGQAAVDQFVLAVLAERLRLPDAARLLTRESPETVEPLRAEAAALRRRLDQVALDYAEGSLTGRQAKLATDTIQAKLGATETALAAAGRTNGLGAVLAAPDPGQAFLDAPLGRQRAVIDALANVTVLPTRRGRTPGWKPGQPYFDPATVSIEWRTA